MSGPSPAPHKNKSQHNNNSTAAASKGNSKHYLDSDPLSHVAAASMTAGAALALITNPLLLIKTKQQTAAATTTSQQHLSYRQAVQLIINGSSHDGRNRFCTVTALRNLSTGLAPHAVSEIVGRGVYFCTYEALKRQFAAQRKQQQQQLPPDHHQPFTTANTLTERMLAAGMSGVVCWSIIFPFDAVRCRMYASANFATANKPPSSFDMAMHMYATAGWRSFYRGFGVTLLRAGPVAALVLPIYDVALERLSS